MNEIIMALDTSSTATGYAIYKGGTITESGTIKLMARCDSKAEAAQERLRQLTKGLRGLIERHGITRIVAEDIFHSTQWQLQSAYNVLTQCQGVIIALAVMYGLPPITLINPLRVKNIMWHYDGSNAYYRNLTREQHKDYMVRAVEALGYKVKRNRGGKPDNDQADAIGILITYVTRFVSLPLTHPA